MRYTFFEMIGYVISQLWHILCALFSGIVALVEIVCAIISSLVIMILNIFAFIPWLIPNCLLPLFYCSVVVLAIKWLVDISNKKGGA